MLTILTRTVSVTVITLSQTAVFGAIAMVVLIALLIAKELLSASKNKKAIRLGRITSIAINPFLFVFLSIVAVKVIEVL